MNYRRIYFRIIILLSILTWCLGFSLNVLVHGSDISIASTGLFNFVYDNICHQDKDKLISINGYNFLVCARCSGIYFGALLSSVFLLFSFRNKEIPLKLFLSASVILFADVVINNFFLSTYNKISAFTTGLFFGSVCLLIAAYQLEAHLLRAKV